jgi:hypothetical protein
LLLLLLLLQCEHDRLDLFWRKRRDLRFQFCRGRQ